MTLLALLLGSLVGFLAARRALSPPVNPLKSPSKSALRESERTGAGTGSLIRSEGNLAEEEEIARLRKRIFDLEARLSTVPATEDEAHKAEEIYKQLKHPTVQEDPKAFMRATGFLADLRPTMTPIFVRKYRESKPQIDSVALELALGSGGPEAAALLKEILGNPSISKAERVSVGISLTGEGLLTQMGSSVRVDSELANLGINSLALADPLERLAGIGILGLQSSDSSRLALQNLVVQDPNEQVRIAALHALGRVGDRSTLDYLHSYATSSFPGLSQDEEADSEKPRSVESALLDTLHKLSQRFAEK